MVIATLEWMIQIQLKEDTKYVEALKTLFNGLDLTGGENVYFTSDYFSKYTIMQLN